MERAVKDDAGDVAPILERHMLDALLLTQRRVIDEVVDAAELFERRPRHRVDGRRIHHIGHGDKPAAADLFNLLHHRFRLGAVLPHVDDHGAASGRELKRHGAPDAAAGAGDDRDAALEFFF
jgi:hypothetical protein